MRGTWSDLLAILLLVLLTIIAFGRVCSNDFVNFDDLTYVTENPHVHAGLTRQSTWWALTTFHFSNWHPLTWLSYQLDYELWGLQAWGYHLTNLLWHIANSVLLYIVLRRLTGSVWRSFFVAALFAVHPLHVESVAWVSERKDVLSTFFGLLALGAYGWYAERPGWGRYLLVVLAFALGLMSKPMLVTWPCVLLLLDYWPLCRWATTHHSPLTTHHSPASLGWLLGEKVPLFVLAAVSSLVTLLAQTGAASSLEALSLQTRVRNALVVYVQYLGKTIWPADLAAFYPHPGDTLPAWQAAGAGLLLLGISVAVLGQARRRPYLPTGWLWYLGTLIPVIGLVQVGEQAMADRYTYVPLVGVFIGAVWGAADLGVRGGWRLSLRVAAVGVVLAALAARTWLQVCHWRDSITLWDHALQVTDDNYVAHYSLGTALDRRERLSEVAEHFTAALRINPVYAKAHNGLGMIRQVQGNLSAAGEHYATALGIDPNYVEARNHLGAVLGSQRKLGEAEHHLRVALQQHPTYASAHNNLGAVLSLQGDRAGAMHHYAEAVRLDPDNGEAHQNLGEALGRQGRPAEAVHHFSEAVRIAPGDARSHYHLGVVLAIQGRLSEATECYRQAVCLQPQVVPYRCSLAAALQEQGQSEAARAEYHQALQLASASQQPELVKQIEEKLRRYEKH